MDQLAIGAAEGSLRSHTSGVSKGGAFQGGRKEENTTAHMQQEEHDCLPDRLHVPSDADQREIPWAVGTKAPASPCPPAAET